MSGAVEGGSNVGKEPILMRGPEATRVWEDAIKESLDKSRKAPSGFGWGFLFLYLRMDSGIPSLPTVAIPCPYTSVAGCGGYSCACMGCSS